MKEGLIIFGVGAAGFYLTGHAIAVLVMLLGAGWLAYTLLVRGK